MGDTKMALTKEHRNFIKYLQWCISETLEEDWTNAQKHLKWANEEYLKIKS